MPSPSSADVVGEQPAAALGHGVDVARDAGGDHRVPHAAASVRVSPKPSRCEALHTTHARRYQSTSSSSVARPTKRIQPVAAQRRGSRLEARAVGPSPTITASRSGTCVRAATTARSRSLMPFCGISRATATTSGRRAALPPGREAVVDAVGGDGDAVGIDAVVLDDLVAGRGRGGQQRAPRGRRGARGAARWRGRRGASGPGSSMSQVPRCTWWTTPTWGSARPQRREERARRGRSR